MVCSPADVLKIQCRAVKVLIEGPAPDLFVWLRQVRFYPVDFSLLTAFYHLRHRPSRNRGVRCSGGVDLQGTFPARFIVICTYTLSTGRHRHHRSASILTRARGRCSARPQREREPANAHRRCRCSFKRFYCEHRDGRSARRFRLGAWCVLPNSLATPLRRGQGQERALLYPSCG